MYRYKSRGNMAFNCAIKLLDHDYLRINKFYEFF